ncbi:phage tail spike protein [Latilactobacillus sakei]|uniref:phage tail spike protein n=1 Tax=Latilactobacillus sakei TaxID=1599 RepID=UPI0039B04494
MSVPIIYEANATDFNNLGLGPLVDTTVATVTEERNGQFILEMQYPVDGIRASLIAKNRILKVDAGHKLKDQRFVIKRINRIMGNDGLSYSIYAEHISYITADYALKPNLTVSGSGNVAMTQWLNGIIDSNRIHVDSDITTENTTSWTIDKVQNARQALGGVQGSILDVWGGEYRFDNLNISLLRHRGTVSNTLLSYGRNITDFDQEENITNTYTSIYPFASYSVQNGDTSEQKILTIPNLVVDSEYVKNFPNRKIQVVDFSDKFSTDEKPTVERLTELAKSYIKNNNVGVPNVSTKISFVDLSKTENYKEFAPLEELDLCDEVPFAFEKFGIKTTAKISRIVWNVLLDSYDSLELGELKTNLSDVINNTNNAALDAKDAANDAKNSADNAALSANGKNRNWYGADDPALGHLSELREGDSWYMPNGEDTELYHWINGQWVFILSTKDTHEAKDAADTASKEAEEAKKQANKAVDGANDAVAQAGFANDTADQAKSDAATALQKALDAYTHGDQIKTGLTADIDAVKGQVSLKASQSDVDKLGGRVTNAEAQIKLQADQIKLTVSKTELTNVLGDYATQTWTQSQIKSTADSINLSVSKVQSNLDNMQVAGVNYLRNSNFEFGNTNWRMWTPGAIPADAKVTFNKISGDSDWPQNTNGYLKIEHPTANGVKYGIAQDHISVVENSDYVVSFECAGSAPLTIEWGDGVTTPYKDIVINPVTHKRMQVTFHTPKGASSMNFCIGFGENQTGTNWISRIMMSQGNKSIDWSPNPSDYTSEVQFSQLQVTVNGIQGTVQNKADQSQVTQLANQITSTVTDLSAYNLITNTEFEDQTLNGWGFLNPSLWSVGFNNSDVYMGSNALHFHRASTQTPIGWTNAGSNWIEVDAGQVVSASAVMYQTGPEGDGWTPTGLFIIEIDFYKDKTSDRMEFYESNVFDIKSPYVKQQLKVENIKVPEGANYARFHVQTNGTGNILIAHPMLVKRATADTYVSGAVSQSQITQLANDINLRVEKNKIVNQINISPEGILIDGNKVHITGQTTIDNAVIKDAMIADIKADKITAGTLNAANVNVINLNANNITTGTIKGANLSMNLNTGEVIFQRGSIKSANGKLNIDINDGTLSVMSSEKSGVIFNDGNMYLSTTSGGWFNPLVDKPKYGSIKYTDNFLTTHPGMTVTGSEGLLLLSGKDARAAAVTETHIANGLGILLGPDNIYIGGDNNTAGSIMTGGKKYQGYFIDDRASVSVGDGDSSTDATINGKTIDLTFSPGGIATTDQGGLFRLSKDGRSQYALSVNTYDRTYSSGAAMTIMSSGVFGRISSASKYKLAIGEISTLNDEAHQFLSVKPKQWFDKSESEALADTMTTGNTDYIDDAKALPHTGFIAEDLYTAGLDNYVIRGNDGSIESIQYDRLPVLHHELIRELFNRLDAAEMEIYKLKQEVINNAS